MNHGFSVGDLQINNGKVTETTNQMLIYMEHDTIYYTTLQHVSMVLNMLYSFFYFNKQARERYMTMLLMMMLLEKLSNYIIH